MKKNIDWPGEWFRAMEDCGEDVSGIFGQIKEGSAQPEWTELPHYDYDGVGGLAYLMRAQGLKVDQVPTLKDDKYTFFRKLRGMMAYLPTAAVRKQKWLKIDPNAKHTALPVHERISWYLFTKEETDEIKFAARTAGVTVNSYLLYHLDAVVSAQLMPPSASRRWSVPVNVRGGVERSAELIHTSFLAVDIDHNFSIKQLHEKIVGLMKRGYHWGAWFGIQGGSMMGQEKMRKYLVDRKQQGESWTGTFSNVGVWDIPGSGHWLVCPNVPYMYPIGAACMTTHGRMGITIQLHHSLGNDARTRQSILDSWIKSSLKNKSFSMQEA